MESLTMFLQSMACSILFFLRFPRRPHFAVRFVSLSILSPVLLHLISGLLDQGMLLVFTYYLIEFAVLLVLLHFCFQTNWEQALYSASAGRAAQHLIYSVLNLIGLRVTGLSAWEYVGSWPELLGAVFLYLPFCLVIYFLFSRKMEPLPNEKADFHRQMNLVSVVIVFVCMGITRFSKGGAVWDKNTYIAANLYAITCCSLCLLMQSELCKRAKLTKEMEMVRMLWKENSKQLAERKDTIDLINMKCHDIRHRLEDYRLPLTNSEEQEVESLIRIYDQSYRTGSQTLDVLLTDRALLCEKHHIQLSFLGDGGCLHFLTEAEVYSLFGNALGNAVEASRELEEEKRQISVIIQNSGDIVSINVTNYYRGELYFDDGLPVTTHFDPEMFHGYGMKSMRAIARKYGGELKVKAEDGVFILTVWLVNGGAGRPE